MRQIMNKTAVLTRNETPVVTHLTGFQVFMAVLWTANLMFFLYYLLNYGK